jgi:ubiquinone/menaquinone biosynthesis C-methylase UbiE
MSIADVGAGSGFMAQIFAEMVGPEGKVFAVDINAAQMKRLADAAAAKGVKNLETVVCSQKSAELPPNSVDLVFICDTYHHFEYPRNTLRSLNEALRPGGQIVVVDFYRIPGVTSDSMMEHVRAGEEVFTKEIEDAGFELINTHYPPQLTENYILRVRKR